jgi:hypothetical protein
MAATIEKAKADDPKLLRAKIAELQKQLAAKPAATPVVKAPKRVEVPVVKSKELASAHKLLDRLQAIATTVNEG